jgi:hypothetical protein
VARFSCCPKRKLSNRRTERKSGQTPHSDGEGAIEQMAHSESQEEAIVRECVELFKYTAPELMKMAPWAVFPWQLFFLRAFRSPYDTYRARRTRSSGKLRIQCCLNRHTAGRVKVSARILINVAATRRMPGLSEANECQWHGSHLDDTRSSSRRKNLVQWKDEGLT